MSNRIKPTRIETLEGFQARVDRAAFLAHQIGELEALRDQRVHEVQQAANPRIDQLRAELATHTADAARYASEHREILFGKRKSASSPAAVFGFRKQTRLIQEGETPEIIGAFQEGGGEPYVKVRYSLDRAAIKRAVQAGVELVCRFFSLASTDEFYIEPKATRAELKEGRG